MPATVVVNLDTSQVQVQPGKNASATVTLRNRSEEVAHYMLTVEGLAPEWADISPAQVSAFPLQEVRSKITVHPPADARAATYHVTVHAISQENASVEGRGLLDVDVPALTPPPVVPAPDNGNGKINPEPQRVAPRPQSAAQIELQAEPITDSKLPPAAAQWRLALRNASGVLDTFGFSITGVRPNWVNIDPAALTLKPDEEASAVLTIRPNGDASGGNYPFKLRAFSHLNLDQRTEIALQMQVRQNAGFKLALSPRDAEAQGMHEFKVTLASDLASNNDLWVDLAASDPDNACDYTFEPSQVFLPAKQTLANTLRVTPKTVLGANERKTYTFQVIATPRDGGAPAQSDQARLTQIGAAPLALAVKPQIQSGELSADYVVNVVNPSTVPTMLFLSGSDPEDACDYIFQPSKLSLPPRGQAQVSLRVRARADMDGGDPQPIPFTIAATRAGELVPAVHADGKFVQQRMGSVTLTLIPPQQSQPGRARYFLKIYNPRSTPVHIWLDAKDEEDAVGFTFRPSEIQLSAGAEGTATLMAQPRDKLPDNQPRRVHKFTVTGNVDGAKTTVTTNGLLAQTRGTEWAHWVATGLRWGVRALKWAIVLLVIIFLGTVLVAGVDRISQQNAQLGRLVYSIVSPQIIRLMLRLSPFSGAAQGIVYLIEGIMNAMQAGR